MVTVISVGEAGVILNWNAWKSIPSNKGGSG